MRLGINLCEPHQCQCGAVVDAYIAVEVQADNSVTVY